MSKITNTIKNKLPFINKKEKPPRIRPQITDILPYSHVEDKYIRLRKGYVGYAEILQIQTTDILSKNEIEVEQYIAGQTGFLRTYLDSFKEINLNFPTNCTTQRDYWEKKLASSTTEVQRKFIERKLYEFDYLEENRTNREFFVMLFSSTVEELQRKARDFKRLSKSSFPVYDIDTQKKTEILFLLNNQNSKIIKNKE